MYRSPVDLQIDEWVYELLERRTHRRRRVLIDSLADLQFAAGDRSASASTCTPYAALRPRRRQRVHDLEVAELFAVTRLSDYGVSHLSDNVLLLQYIRDGAAIRRAVTVLKTRATKNETQVREFTITADGITLGDTIDSRPSNAIA